MDNSLEVLKKQREDLKKIIDFTTAQNKQLRSKSPEEKKNIFLDVQSNAYVEFKQWFADIRVTVRTYNLSFNKDLLQFTKPLLKLDFETHSQIGGFIDAMDGYYRHLDNAIELFEHRDIIGLARDFDPTAR